MMNQRKSSYNSYLPSTSTTTTKTPKNRNQGRNGRRCDVIVLFYLSMTIFILWLFFAFKFEQHIDSEFMKHSGRFEAFTKPGKDKITFLNNNDHDGKNNKNTNRITEMNDPDAFLTMYGKHRFQNSFDALPQWLQEYFIWHKEQTAKEAALSASASSTSNDEKAEVKYAVLTCLPEDPCGGLSDRLRPLLFYLYAAKHTNRVLCIYWKKNFGLEEYLQPIPDIGIEWRCPNDIDGYYDLTKMAKRQPKVRLFKYAFCRRDKIPFAQCVEQDIQKTNDNMQGRFISIGLVTREPDRVNRANLLIQRHSYGGEQPNKDGEYLMPNIDAWQYPEMIEHIFRVMFEPTPTLAKRINSTMAQLELVENNFVTAHLRARYPTGVLKNYFGSLDFDLNGGLKFEGKVKTYMINLLENALECGHLLAPDLKMLIISDHNEVTKFAIQNDFIFEKTGEGVAMRPVAIVRDEEPLHMEGNHSFKAVEDFYPVFEDLLIMGGSRCVAHGIGSFGSFGAGLAGNKCRAIHRIHSGGSLKCPNDRVDISPIVINATQMAFGEKPGGEGKMVYDERKYTISGLKHKPQ